VIGWDENTKGYKCYCFDTKKVIIFQDVKIDETKLAGEQLPAETAHTFHTPSIVVIHQGMFSNLVPTDAANDQMSPNPSYSTSHQLGHKTQGPVYSSTPLETDRTDSNARQDRLHLENQPDQTNSNLASSHTQDARVYTRRTPEPLPLRRSECHKKPSVLLENYVANLEHDITINQAVTDPDSKHAMDEEMGSITKIKTWKLVPLPPRKRAITSKWIFNVKPGINGQGSRYKARLVARGFEQQQGCDFSETFALVAKFNTIKSIIAPASSKGWDINHFDVKTTFLNGKLREEVYLTQP